MQRIQTDTTPRAQPGRVQTDRGQVHVISDGVRSVSHRDGEREKEGQERMERKERGEEGEGRER